MAFPTHLVLSNRILVCGRGAPVLAKPDGMTQQLINYLLTALGILVQLDILIPKTNATLNFTISLSGTPCLCQNVRVGNIALPLTINVGYYYFLRSVLLRHQLADEGFTLVPRSGVFVGA